MNSSNLAVDICLIIRYFELLYNKKQVLPFPSLMWRLSPTLDGDCDWAARKMSYRLNTWLKSNLANHSLPLLLFQKLQDEGH